jgi:hypothetical protein
MVFESAGKAGAYLGGYLTGGQLERAASATDRSWGLFWINPQLLQRSGWNMARCRWVRQGWVWLRGGWTSRNWYGRPSNPSWWYRPEDRAWVLAVLGHS